MIKFRLPWYRPNPAQTSISAGTRICEVLGLDPKSTQDITIHINVGDFLWFEVKHLLREDKTNRLTGFLETQKFQLVSTSEAVDIRKLEKPEDTNPIADVTGQGENLRKFAV